MKIKNRCVMCRALSVILALLMLLTVMPLTVVAEETETRTFETGDIIGFGSYPQSEITDEELKNALTAAAGSTDKWTSYNYYISGTQSDYMKYTDVEYDGEKYRGVYFTQYRPYYTTGSSSSTCQDDNGYSTSTIYWFKYEPMKWQVLSYDSTTGEAVVLSKSIIDSQQYYYTTSSRTIDGKTVYANNYEHSDIRTWLNDTFYNTAFSASEKNAIVATTLDNSAYSTDYSKYDSNSTTDNVWLLSYSEVQNTAYGFTSDYCDTETRQATGTAYALSQGFCKRGGNSGWHLRSADSDFYYACYVDYDGSVSNGIVYITCYGVRPALTLNLTSDCDHAWETTVTSPTCTDTGYTTYYCTKCSRSYDDNFTDALGHDFSEKIIDEEYLATAATVTSPAKYYYDCSRCDTMSDTDTFEDGDPLKTSYYVGDIVEFGSYPQSEVTDAPLKSTLTSKAGSTDSWTSYGYYFGNEQYEEVQSDYMKYTDIEYDGAKYRGVYFTQYRPYWTFFPPIDNDGYVYSHQVSNGYSTSTIYWFKYEPMEWQVLSYNSTTGEAIVLSKSIIDSQQYYNNIDLLTSRTIDGETVYANNYEHSDIRTWLNDTFYNTAFGTSEKNAIVATTLDNSAYDTYFSMFSSNSTTDNVWLLSYSEAKKTAYGFISDTERQATGTAYALCQGLLKYSSDGCSSWRLRSAGGSHYIACIVDYDGTVNGSSVNYTSDGVRPALTLNLTAEIFPSCVHTWQSEITLPTCTERGYTTCYCTKCSRRYDDNFTDALGHNFTSETVNAKYLKDEETCITAAVYYKSCTRCGVTGEATFEYGNALGHDFSEKIIDEEHLASAATVTSPAKYYYDCSRCNTIGENTFEDGKPLKTVEFGSYPQSEVTDATLKSTLTSRAGSTDNWTSYGYYIGNEQYEPVQSDYMKYTDVEYDGSKYRGVYFTQYRPYWTIYSSSTDNSYQDDNGYSTSTIYWFKYEPMKWQVLSCDSTTGEAIVLSKSIIDSQQYYYDYENTRTIDGATVYPNNYEHSDIRTWLNDTFYNTAFGTSEKNAIVATTLDNSAYSTSYSEYDSNSTTDNVWLLSYSEMQNTAYGFTYSSGTKKATGTAYALCQGLGEYTLNNCSNWRLRSAGFYSSRACYVDSDGWVSADYDYVNYTDDGVRPALTLNLTSEIDSTESTTESSEESTTKSSIEPTTKSSEESTTTQSEASTTKLSEEPTAKPTTEPTTEGSTTEPATEESTTEQSTEESTTVESTTEPITEKTTAEPTTESTAEPTVAPTIAPTTAKRETVAETESTTKRVTVPIADIIASVAKKVDTVRAAKTDDGASALIAVCGTNAAVIRNAASGAKIVDKDGKEVSDTAPLATGMKIVFDGETVEIAVLGDIDGNGEISVTDARLALRQAVSLENLKGVYLLAAQVGNDTVSVSEARKILRAAVGLDDSKDWLK